MYPSKFEWDLIPTDPGPSKLRSSYEILRFRGPWNVGPVGDFLEEGVDFKTYRFAIAVIIVSDMFTKLQKTQNTRNNLATSPQLPFGTFLNSKLEFPQQNQEAIYYKPPQMPTQERTPKIGWPHISAWICLVYMIE